MSLESQIGSLVEAANHLTGTVVGKVEEIDEAIDRNKQSVEESRGEFETWRDNFRSPGTIDAEDMEGFLPNGFYRINDQENTTGTQYGQLITYNYREDDEDGTVSNPCYAQIFIPTRRGASRLGRGESAVMLFRSYERQLGGWTPWREIVHNENAVGTIEYLDIETNERDEDGEFILEKGHSGALFESGSNANGRYAKYADGTLICHYSGVLEGGQQDMQVRSLGDTTVYHCDNSRTWVFPHAFVDTPSVSGSCGFRSTGWRSHSNTYYLGPGSSSVNYRHSGLYINDSESGDIEFTHMAIGRWY